MGLPSKRAAWLHSRQPHRSTFVIPSQARNPWCPGRESSPVSDTLARTVGRLERQDAERAGPLARPSQKAAEAPRGRDGGGTPDPFERGTASGRRALPEAVPEKRQTVGR